MYIIRDIFGAIRVCHDLDSAEEIYFDTIAFCGCAGLYDAYTGEVIMESW